MENHDISIATELFSYKQVPCQRVYNEIPSRKIILYGAGYCGVMFLDLLKEIQIKPLLFFDRDKNKIGKKISGVKIKTPYKVLGDIDEIFIVVCLLTKEDIFIIIKDELTLMGYKNVIHIFELRDYKKLFINQKLIISPNKSLIMNNLDKINDVYGMLNDELSQQTYLSLFQFMLNDINEKIPHFPINMQYFDYDIYKRSQSEVIIDCGAFKGNVMEIFINNNKNVFKNYVAFEPDYDYYCNLKQKKLNDNRIFLYNLALGDEDKELKLKNYKNENSVICEEGDHTIECVRLDNFINNFEPTFLKIDVEGFEKKLIKGAQNVIIKYKPLIAIAIYHKERDLWDIPIILNKMLPNHKLFIRSYMNINETILYVVPERRCLT